MATNTMTTTAAAAALGVNAMTVRRWCAAHAKHLSTGANPKAKGTRKLSGRDLEVLRTVAQLRVRGANTSQINEQLAATVFPDVDEDEQENAQDAPGAHEHPTEEEYTALVRLSVLEAVHSADRERWEQERREYQQRVEELLLEVGALRGQRRKRPGWLAKLFGGDA